MDSYRLVMRTGPTVGMAYPLEKSEMYLGRDLGNDISVNDPEMSRRHARIYKQGASYILEDLGSTNGTFINSQRLMGPYMLRPGEVIVFGENISLVFEIVQSESDATIAAGAPKIETQARPQPVPQPVPQPSPQPVQPQPAPTSSFQQPVGYSGQVPGEFEESEPPKKFPVWIIIVIAAILLLCCICIVAFYFLDNGNVITREMWCNWLGFLFNIIKPGSCS